MGRLTEVPFQDGRFLDSVPCGENVAQSILVAADTFEMRVMQAVLVIDLHGFEVIEILYPQRDRSAVLFRVGDRFLDVVEVDGDQVHAGNESGLSGRLSHNTTRDAALWKCCRTLSAAARYADTFSTTSSCLRVLLMFRFLRSPLVAICLVVIGGFVIYTGHKNSVKFAALRDHGKTAKADITKLEWKERKITHGASTFVAHIRFRTEDGREIQTETGIPPTFGQALRNNSVPQSMTIRYLPESPSSIEDINKDDSSEAEQGVGRFMLLAGLAMLALSYFLSRSPARPSLKR